MNIPIDVGTTLELGPIWPVYSADGTLERATWRVVGISRNDWYRDSDGVERLASVVFHLEDAADGPPLGDGEITFLHVPIGDAADAQ